MRARRGPGTGTNGSLPRVRPAPEHNIIQRPELIRSLQQRLGLRQAHITPALQEGVQAVVILDSLLDNARITSVPYLSHVFSVNDPGVSPAMVSFFNLAGSGRRCRIRHVWISAVDTQQQIMNIGFQAAASMASPTAISPGSPMHVIGVDPLPTPDLKAMPTVSAGRLIAHAGSPAGIGTVFEHETARAAPLSSPSIWEWMPNELWIYPNGAMIFWWDGGTVTPTQMNCTVEWSEEMIQS